MLNSIPKEQLHVLGHEGLGFTERRDIGKDQFVGINPRKTKDGRKAEDVAYLTCIVIDVDPIRPKGFNATDAQALEAMHIATDIRFDFIKKYSKSWICTVTSGNGAHVYIPIEPIKITSYKGLTESLRELCYSFKVKYEKQGFKVDTIFDLPRVIRVWGSINSKNGKKCYLVYNQTGNRLKLKLSQEEKAKVPVIAVGSNAELDKKFSYVIASSYKLAKFMGGTAIYPSRSEADYAFIGELLKSGFNQTEIGYLAKKNPLGRMGELKKADIERVIGKFINNGLTVKSTQVYGNLYIESLKLRKPGISTGFDQLDYATGGLRPEPFIISARPGNGKTSMCCQLALNLAKAGKKVLIFPTELSSGPIMDKVMAQVADIELKRFRDGSFSKEDFKKLHDFKDEFSKLPLVVAEDFSLTVEKIESKLKIIQPDVLMIDYIQAMKFKDGGTSWELTATMQGLTRLAEQYKTPVVIFSQLSRPSEASKLSMAHLKGSGSLEEKARVVVALDVIDWYASPRPVDLYILKNSYGDTCKIPMSFIKEYGKFKEGRK